MDPETRAKLEEFEAFSRTSASDRRRLNERLARAIHRGMIILIALFLVQVFTGVGVILVNADQGQTAERAEKLAKQIQASRLEQIRLNCETQNTRNRATVTLLKNLPHRQNDGGPKPGTKAYDALLHTFTDALAGPVRDCNRVVRHLASQTVK